MADYTLQLPGADIDARLAKVPQLESALAGKQDTLVGSGTGQNVKTINGQSIVGPGDITVEGGGEDGVGFDDVSTQQDGTIVITLTNGDTITIDLNHNHPQYTKAVVCPTVSDYDAISPKDSMTFYVIPGVALYLGTNLVVEQSVPLPYTPVEYIETDGTAYIDTGVNGASPMSVEGRMYPVLPSTGNYYAFGVRKDSGNTRMAFLLLESAKHAGFGYANGGYPDAIDISDSVDNQTPFEFKTVLKNGTCVLSIKQQGESSFTDYTKSIAYSVSTERHIFLFCWNNQGTASSPLSGNRFGNVKIYSDDSFSTLVWDGVPCIYNNQYGMWDRVSDTFFGNAAGSGAFTGPQI